MKKRVEWRREGRLIGCQGHHYDSVSSTNTLALEEASDPAKDGLVILAHAQTSGRGQHGRQWTAPAGSSVLMSVLVFPPPTLQRAALLTAWAAVGVCETIETLTGLSATIKWPNDVLLCGKKVCGILIEQRGGVVAGIGLNLLQTRADLDAAGLPEATSLLIARRKPYSLERTIWLLLDNLDRLYDRMRQDSLDELEQGWRDRLGLLGQSVTAECHSGAVHGVLRRLSFAAVEIDLGAGTVCRLLPEAIRHLWLDAR